MMVKRSSSESPYRRPGLYNSPSLWARSVGYETVSGVPTEWPDLQPDQAGQHLLAPKCIRATASGIGHGLDRGWDRPRARPEQPRSMQVRSRHCRVCRGSNAPEFLGEDVGSCGRPCSTLGAARVEEGGFRRQPEHHSGAPCCLTYCLITDSGAPPHETMQYDRDQNTGLR